MIGRGAAALLVLILVACGSPPAPASAPREPAKPAVALHRGPLTDYVASAGLRWMLVGAPERLLANPDVARAVATLIPPVRLQRFTAASGVDLQVTPSALCAGFDYATLYVVATPGGGGRIEDHFVERLLSGPIASEPVTGLRRVSGVIGTTPQTLVRIENQLVAVAVGDPTPTRVVEAYARGKLRKSPTALSGSALSTLPAEMHTAMLRFYAPGPFQGEWAEGARGLLAGAVALGVAVNPLPGGQIAAQVHVTGDFGSDSEARSTLLAAWRDLAESSLGKLLGFDRPVSAPVLSAARDLLTLEVVLELQPIARGLHAAVSADVWQMLELSPPAR